MIMIARCHIHQLAGFATFEFCNILLDIIAGMDIQFSTDHTIGLVIDKDILDPASQINDGL